MRIVRLLGTCLLVSTFGCAYKPWGTYSVPAAKPTPPLRSPSDSGLLVVIVVTPQGAGNGGYTVFDADGPVAQFDSRVSGWSSMPAKPGKHSYYVRSWTSDFCVRVDAEVASSKIYVLALNASLGAQKLYPLPAFLGPGDPMSPAAQLGQQPFLTLDLPAARAVLAAHESQREKCVANANAAFKPGPLPGGFDTIDWTPSAPKP